MKALIKHPNAKRCSIRHGGGSRRSCNAQEKAIETATRQAGRREIRRTCPDAEVRP